MHCTLAAQFDGFFSLGRHLSGFLCSAGSFLLGCSQLPYTGYKATKSSSPGFTFA
jgi:hypothetical protein